MSLVVLANLALAAVATAIIWKSSEWLETASQAIATHYGIPEIVKGAVITAVASSFPELASVIIAVAGHGEFELGVAGIAGSAIFNILVIPACSVFFGGTLQANRELIYKESLFYLIAIAVLLLTFSFATIYYPVNNDHSIVGEINFQLALIPFAVYCVYLFLQFQDAKEHRLQLKYNGSPAVEEHPKSIVRHWAVLIVSMLIIAVAVEFLIRAAINLGNLFQTPSFLWGLTVIAAGTSLPDMFISIKAAREGRSITSLSNVLGSNTFDLLVAIPFGVFLGGSTTINFSYAVPMMASVTLVTIVTMVLMRVGMSLNVRKAKILLAMYLGFLFWVAV